MHKNVKSLFRQHALDLFTGQRRVLEIGPDRHPSTLQAMAGIPDARWHTLDFAGRADVDLTYRATDAYAYPVPDASYDIVLAANVLEHVPAIWVWIHELARICRPGGYVVTISPVSWHYHESPVDCWRMYPAGARALLEHAGLEPMVTEWGSAGLAWLDRRIRWMRPKQLLQRLSGVFLLWNAVTRLPPEGAYDTIAVGRRSDDDNIIPDNDITRDT